MDVKSEFLNGDLEEEVYIENPEGFSLIEEGDMVCKLKKEFYGLKKSPITRYVRLDKYLKKLGFSKGTVDSKLYLKEIDNGLLIIVIFVDDIIYGCSDETSDKIRDEMKNEFEMSMIGEIKYFFGSQIVQNCDGIFLSQTNYLKELLKKFGLKICKALGIPMITDQNLSSKDETSTVEQKKYRPMIGSLQYLTHTRLDITNYTWYSSKISSQS